MTMKTDKKVIIFLLILFLIFVIIACIQNTIYYNRAESYKETALNFCQAYNYQKGALDKTLPAWQDKICNDYKSLVNDTIKQEIFCKEVYEIEVPDEADCGGLE